jgi:hypothetical protein
MNFRGKRIGTKAAINMSSQWNFLKRKTETRYDKTRQRT